MGIFKSTKLNESVESVTDVSGVSSRQRKTKLLLFFALTGIVVACAWSAYVWYGKPRLDEHRLEVALAALSASPEQKVGAAAKYLREQPREKMLLETFEVFSSPLKSIDDALRLNGARAALDLAILEGSNEARLLLGKAFRDGTLGQKDSIAALREFEKVSSSMEPGVKAGDASALYTYALMLYEGLGIPLDKGVAVAMMARAADGLKGWRLNIVGKAAVYGSGMFSGASNPELANRIASRLVAAGDHSAHTIGAASCRNLHETEGRRNACREQWIKDAAVANYKQAMSSYAQILLHDYGDIELASEWYEAAGSARSNYDNYYYGVVKAILATDSEAFTLAVKMMWTALQQSKEQSDPLLECASGTLQLSFEVEKALAKNKGNSRSRFAVALVAQGELQGKKYETIQAGFEKIVTMKYMRPLIDSPTNRRAALVVAEAIRENKTFTQVAEAQAATNSISFGKSDVPVSAATSA